MKTYYSIVSIATKPQLNEKFNIGLLCVTPEKTFFHFSEAKFNIVSKLLSQNGSKLALSVLQGMDKQINFPQKANSGIFTHNQIDVLNATSESYINYLNRYNNNLVQYSKPILIDAVIDNNVFKILFKKYIYSEEVFDVVKEPKTKSFATIRNKFRKAASPYANTNFDVTQEVIKGLIAPVNVDVFGKNGVFVTGQSLDFDKNSQHLQSEITSYLYLTDKTLIVDSKAKIFVLGDEPSKKEIANHQLWKSINDTSFIEFVPTDESERIIAYMRKNGVEPIE